MNGQEIGNSVRERDLGVQIEENLDWEAQVGKAVTRANKILGMIWRTYDNKSMKNIIQLYKSLVRPHLEYAMQIWRPYKQKHVNLLEGVQRRATRMIDKLRQLTYDERLRRTSLLSLEARRQRADLIQVYKILHNIDDIPGNTLFPINTGRTRGHNLRLKKEYSRLDVRKYFFSQRIVNEWNALPPDVVNSGSVNEFKNRIKPLFDSIRSHSISLRRLPAPLMTASARDY